MSSLSCSKPAPVETTTPAPAKKQVETWPQADRLATALSAIGMTPDEKFRTIKIPENAITESTKYIVLPVQTQALGFAPSFRAAVGAQLDEALSLGGIHTVQQTDLADINGPFVRSFDEATLQALLKQYQQQKLIMLYLGQDKGQNFVTLVIRSQNESIKAHKSLELPQDPEQALDIIKKSLPALLKEAGLKEAGEPPAASNDGSICAESNWDFSLPASGKDRLQQACHALAVGTLLPAYDYVKASILDYGRLMSPLKRAWLARAYAKADMGPSAPPVAQVIRTLALQQLGLSLTGSYEISPMLLSSTDPIVSQVAKLLARANGKPSDTHGLEKLPALTRLLMNERLNIEDPSKPVKFCDIAAYFSGLPTPESCPSSKTQNGQAKALSSAELALYQDWRLLSHYKNAARYVRFLGLPEQGLMLLAQSPEDIAGHPYLQQIKHTAQQSMKFTGNAGDFLVHKQALLKPYLQMIVNLQRYDSWLATSSLSDHYIGNGSQNIDNDRQIQEARSKEAQLIKILKADRFLTSSLPTPQQAAMMAAIQAAPKADATKQGLFPLRFHLFKTPSEEQLLSKLKQYPGDMDSRVALAFRHLKEGKEGKTLQDALKIINAYPKSAEINDRVKESHDWAAPAHGFFFSGELEAAKQFYQRSLAMGTGSSSEFHAQTRLKLIDSRLGEAMQSSIQALARYNSDFTRRDLASFLFMEGQAEMGWQVIQPRAATAETFQLWVAAYVAQRMEGKSLDQINDWLKSQKYDSVQIDLQDVNDLYVHMHAVTDRVPNNDDIKLLLKPSAPNKYRNKTFAVSAQLIKSALEQSGTKEAYEFAIANLAPYDANKRNQFVLPFFAWVAWQASDGKDANLDTVRNADLHESFDHVLAKSMIFALEGKSRESLQYLKAARYGLSESGKSEMRERGIPPSYQYATAAYLMFKKTGNDAYRTEALQFLRSYELVFPYYGWVYSMQAAMEKDKKRQQTLACKAKALDPGSYFLSLSNLDLNKLSCKTALW
ncbi:hypothetical protein [Undibacterium umbellatum]|uniref:Uncharacterized protein n=1 Tax=Undibacterium umbellatum TaxID=2762300 RepID=A0ABR6ZBK5_9BURK|nr:hypothetical protein [Undibacterium umbellatum]MBC3908582.1 hypothetical protein [Undibacterium umbellatum]